VSAWTTTRFGPWSLDWPEPIPPAAPSSSGPRSSPPQGLDSRRSRRGSSPTAGNPRPRWRHRPDTACTDPVVMPAEGPNHVHRPASCFLPALSTDPAPNSGFPLGNGQQSVAAAGVHAHCSSERRHDRGLGPERIEDEKFAALGAAGRERDGTVHGTPPLRNRVHVLQDASMRPSADSVSRRAPRSESSVHPACTSGSST
jgi:hypothetical protein